MLLLKCHTLLSPSFLFLFSFSHPSQEEKRSIWSFKVENWIVLLPFVLCFACECKIGPGLSKAWATPWGLSCHCWCVWTQVETGKSDHLELCSVEGKNGVRGISSLPTRTAGPHEFHVTPVWKHFLGVIHLIYLRFLGCRFFKLFIAFSRGTTGKLKLMVEICSKYSVASN